MRSLQSKLSLGLLLSLIVAFSSLWLLVSISVKYLAEDYIASRLKHDSETLLNSVEFDQNGKLMVDSARIDLIYNQPFSGHYYVLSRNKQSILSRSLWDQSLPYIDLKAGQEYTTIQQGPEQQSLLLLSVAYKKQGYTFTITVAEDLNPINKDINRFSYWFALMALGMLLALLLLQAYILGKSLRPLIEIKQELALLQKGQLNKLSSDFPTELQPLIQEVNHLLELMKKRLHRSRDALSDLAHAIKKPLTIIKQITDKNDMPETIKQEVIKQADSIYQISDRILKRARLAGHSHSGTLFSLTEDLPMLIKTLNMMYADKTIQLIENIPSDVPRSIDREDMLELLGNLLDNAYKWAEREVKITVLANAELHICIEDDGPGADPEKIDELSIRGVRLDETVCGHGFGLAISTDIINDYDGHIIFSKSTALGGFKTELTLPLNIL